MRVKQCSRLCFCLASLLYARCSLAHKRCTLTSTIRQYGSRLRWYPSVFVPSLPFMNILPSSHFSLKTLAQFSKSPARYAGSDAPHTRSPLKVQRWEEGSTSGSHLRFSPPVPTSADKNTEGMKGRNVCEMSSHRLQIR